MYELIIRDFKNLQIIISYLKSNEMLKLFINSFGTIAISNYIEELMKIASELPAEIKTQIIKHKNYTLLSPLRITDIKVYNDKLKLNTNIEIFMREIIAISIEAIRIPTLKESILTQRDIKNIFFDDFYISLKLITTEKIYWSDTYTRFYSYTSLYKLSENYDDNIRKLISMFKSLNNRIIYSPTINMYLSKDNYIKYFISDVLTSKEILWMKKLNIINI